ncbi:hypothetical protein MAPG_11355 [Magnaporthiopsis poae ATCC 64411]|uniref:FAD-binding domain-containing protein n=1 Tax=Magnaporthiopsis poae (strain ATCC 64411 / 73-15) TaxID=644358 RepID=A0A0C4EF20_MAGP6|nr:hypothetical protein MAPG_11355 [Magnaporthiopsis poae ATCC 64411]
MVPRLVGSRQEYLPGVSSVESSQHRRVMLLSRLIQLDNNKSKAHCTPRQQPGSTLHPSIHPFSCLPPAAGMSADDERRFRIIVIGAGISGLVASNYLQRLDIDHVVLEQNTEVAPATAGVISLWPHAVRILQQLGCLEAVRRVSKPYSRILTRGQDGKLLLDSGLLERLWVSHGAPAYPINRQTLLQILYDALPDKSLIRTGVAVEAIEQYPDGAKVRLGDGRVETGDMVLGCDGVRSPTRSLMWEHAARASPGLIQASEKTSLRTLYQALLVTAPPMAEQLDGDSNLVVTQGSDLCFMAVTQPDTTYLLAIEPATPGPFSWPHRRHFTDADAEAMAARIADRPVTDGILFSEIWRRRTRASMVTLEEGVMDHWHHGRICLGGDAVHKFQPSLAMGGSAAMESVVSLINHLQTALVRFSPATSFAAQKPSGTALNMAFAAYQAQERDRMRWMRDACCGLAKTQMYATPWHRLLGQWLIPRVVGDGALGEQISAYIAGAPRMAFLPSVGLPKGRIPWAGEHDEEGAHSDWGSGRVNLGAGGAAEPYVAQEGMGNGSLERQIRVTTAA